MNSKAAVELLKEVKLGRLCEFEGCICVSCQIQGIDIEVSCWRSCGSVSNIDSEFYGVVIRVHSSHGDSNSNDLQAVADEVAAQIRSMLEDSSLPIMIRLCSYEHDKNVRCLYCGNPRENAAGYYCNNHLDKAA